MKSHNSLEEEPKIIVNAKRRFSVDDGQLNSFSSNMIEQNIHSQSSFSNNNVGYWENSRNKKALIGGASAIIGLGVGMAMMPIFNEEVEHLEDYGVNVHDSESWLIVSTINTLLLMGSYAALTLYQYFSTEDKNVDYSNKQKIALNIARVVSFSGGLLPLSLLWSIELSNQEISDSDGFDQYIAWASISTAPLVIDKAVKTYQTLHKAINKGRDITELNSLGSKIAVYGIDAISLISRGISYNFAIEQLLEKLGCTEEQALPISITLGGIIGNITVGAMEHSRLKYIFTKQEENLNWKDITVATLSAAEGIWFSLPAISAGLEATEGWNNLIRGGLFLPMFIAHANAESTRIFDTFMPKLPYQNQEDLEISLIGDGTEKLDQDHEY